jgi:hypothetical protein
MEDFAYLARDSVAAWLQGRGDGRFERYECFYRRERDTTGFDLEKSNEEYGAWMSGQSPRRRLLALINGEWFARATIAFLAFYFATRAIPVLASRVPAATGCLIVIAFIGLRIFHRKRRKSR